MLDLGCLEQPRLLQGSDHRATAAWSAARTGRHRVGYALNGGSPSMSARKRSSWAARHASGDSQPTTLTSRASPA